MASASPFVPRDVFRLVVRLEAQKTHDVDTAALEKRFQVPKDYGKDEAEERRDQAARLVTPGPGANEYRDEWPCSESKSTSTPSAVFASKAPRTTVFSVVPTASNRSQAPDADSSREYLDAPPPLGSFTRADRGISSPTVKQSEGNQVHTNGEARTGLRPSTRRQLEGLSFAKAPRELSASVGSRLELGPAEYDVRRLWDPSRGSSLASPDAPTPAVFGASTDSRKVVWSTARTLPSNAIPEAWNASPHYAKHKRQVLLAIEHQRVSASQSLSHASSVPTLGLAARSRGKKKHANSDLPPGLDPFEWLRQQPNGEQRANALAQRHGLAQFVRPLAASVPELATVGAADAEADSRSPATEVKAPEPDVATSNSESQRLGGHMDEDQAAFVTRLATATKDHGTRIAVSCRLPGGLVLSVKIYPTRRVRHLKTALLRQQSRFQNEDQFDLYSVTGKILSPVDATLLQCGVRDRALVQVVPR